MKLTNIKRFLVEDFSDQAEWIEKLIGPLNGFIESTTKAINGRLTFTENMGSEIKTIDVFANSQFPMKIKTQIVHPVAVWVVNVQVSRPIGTVFLDWEAERDQIIINNVFGIDKSKDYKISLIASRG